MEKSLFFSNGRDSNPSDVRGQAQIGNINFYDTSSCQPSDFDCVRESAVRFYGSSGQTATEDVSFVCASEKKEETDNCLVYTQTCEQTQAGQTGGGNGKAGGLNSTSSLTTSPSFAGLACVDSPVVSVVDAGLQCVNEQGAGCGNVEFQGGVNVQGPINFPYNV